MVFPVTITGPALPVMWIGPLMVAPLSVTPPESSVRVIRPVMLSAGQDAPLTPPTRTGPPRRSPRPGR